MSCWVLGSVIPAKAGIHSVIPANAGIHSVIPPSAVPWLKPWAELPHGVLGVVRRHVSGSIEWAPGLACLPGLQPRKRESMTFDCKGACLSYPGPRPGASKSMARHSSLSSCQPLSQYNCRTDIDLYAMTAITADFRVWHDFPRHPSSPQFHQWPLGDTHVIPHHH